MWITQHFVYLSTYNRLNILDAYLANCWIYIANLAYSAPSPLTCGDIHAASVSGMFTYSQDRQLSWESHPESPIIQYQQEGMEKGPTKDSSSTT